MSLKLMKFEAPWCAPCRAMKPVVEEVLSDFDSIELVEVNIDEDSDSAVNHGVRSIPTLILLKDGKKIGSLIGSRSVEELREFLTNNS